MKNKLLSLLLVVVMLVGTAAPAASALAASGPSVSAKMNGSSKIDVTVVDDSGSYKETIAWVKNTTLSCSVGGYGVEIITNGSGINKFYITSAPQLEEPAAPPPEEPAVPPPEEPVAPPLPEPPEGAEPPDTPEQSDPTEPEGTDEPTDIPTTDGQNSPAFVSTGAATIKTATKGADVTITVNDGAYTFTYVVTFEKNKTVTYNFTEGYTVQIAYNGSGVNKAIIISTPTAPTEPSIPESVTNAPEPKPGVALNGGDMTWNAYDKAAAAKKFTQSSAKDKKPPETALVPVESKKLDASGDKIPSNAHSGDFPGIYFYWNDQQKDDGILKIDPAIFDWFEEIDGERSFFITAKNSDAYWDYFIYEDDPKAAVTEEGYLLYQIPRYFMYLEANNKNGVWETKPDELENINMIFLDGLWRTYELNIVKVWLDRNGELTNNPGASVSFTDGYSLGRNVIRLYNDQTRLVAFKENNVNRYKFISVTGDGVIDPDVNEVEFVAESGGVYEVTFTNLCTDVEISIEKKWTGLWDDLPLAQQNALKAAVRFSNSFVLGLNVKPSGPIQFSENAINWSWISDDGVWEYTAKFVKAEKTDGGVVLETYAGNLVSLTAEDNSKYFFVFTNEIVKTDVSGTLEVKKNWEGYYNALDADVLADLEASLTFGDYELNKQVKVGANKLITVSETIPAWTWVDGYYTYSVQFTRVAVTGASNGASGNNVRFTTGKNGAYVITFTNTITRKALDAKVTVTKEWYEGLNEITDEALITELSKKLTWTRGPVNSPYTVGGETTFTSSESIAAGAVEFGDYSYTISFGSVTVDGGTVGVSGQGVSFQTGPNGNHTVAYINKVTKTPLKAKVTVTKEWYDGTDLITEAGLLTELNEKLTWINGPIGSPYTVGGETTFNSSETIEVGDVEYGDYSYAISFVSVTVDNGTPQITSTSVSFPTDANGNHTVAYINKVTKTPLKAKVTVTKEWYDGTDLITEAGLLTELNAKLTWINGPIGSPYTVGGETTFNSSETIEAGDVEYGDYSYAISFVSVTVDNGTPQITSTSVSFPTDANGNHTVAYINKVTKTALDAKVTVTKEWYDGTDLITDPGLLAKLNAKLTWTNGPTNSPYTVEGEKTFNASETIEVGDVEYGDYSYEISFGSVTVDNRTPQITSPSVSFTTDANGEHTVVYINKVTKTALDATVSVTKTWKIYVEDDDDIVIDDGALLDKLNELITWTEHGPGTYTVGGEEDFTSTEEYDAGAYVDYEGYRYTISLSSVSVNAIASANTGTSITFETAANGSHTVSFVNTVTVTPLTTKFNIVKIWDGWDDDDSIWNEIDEDAREELIAMLDNAFGDYVLGENEVLIGDPIEVSEDTSVFDEWSWLSDDGKYEYAGVVLVEVTADNDAVVDADDVVTFTAEEGVVVTVTFTNAVVKTMLPTIWVEKVWTAFGRGKDGELTEIELPPGVLDAIKVIFEEEPFTDDYVLGDNGFVSTGTEIEFSEIIPDLSDNPDLEDYTIEFVSVVIDDQGNPVTNLGDDETQVSFITEGDGVYTITFTNRVVQKYTPVGATGQIYKGSENVGPGNAPWMQNGIDKDPGSGSGPGRYFGGNQGAGGSYDTIYISFDYYDSNNDLQTVNGWLNLVPTSAARPGGWTFYVQVDDGYFELTLNLADRGNGGDGHRYQDVQINDLRIVDFHPGVTIPVGNQDSTLIHYDPADLPYGVGG